MIPFKGRKVYYTNLASQLVDRTNNLNQISNQ